MKSIREAFETYVQWKAINQDPLDLYPKLKKLNFQYDGCINNRNFYSKGKFIILEHQGDFYLSDKNYNYNSEKLSEEEIVSLYYKYRSSKLQSLVNEINKL